MKRLILFFFVLSLGNLYSQKASFKEIGKSAGVNINGKCYGAAFADYNNDGYDDLYVSRQGESNRLYKNNGDNTFEDVSLFSNTDYSGPTRASVWADFDNDGYQDLFLANWDAPCVYFKNSGNGYFINDTYNKGVGVIGRPNSVNVADVNNDGWLDIYIAFMGQENVLFLNNGDGTFKDFTKESGATDPSISMAALFVDFDNDGDQDLYLAHDANIPYILYENDGFGHFKNISAKAGVNYAGQGMGVDFGDVNNDGLMDLHITNLYENTLFVNNGDGTFRDVSKSAGIQDRGMGWGTMVFDYNNDGLNDIYVVNDTKFTPSSYTNKLYRNNGNITFTEVSENTPLASPYEGYGAAYSDINHDGKLDIFVAIKGQEGSQLFLNNEINTGHWLQIKCIGTKSNRDGIGARINIKCANQLYCDQISSSSGYVSQNSLLQHFGLGTHSKIDELEIIWPSGLKDIYKNLSVDQVITVKEGLSIETKWAVNTTQQTINNPKMVYQGISPFGIKFDLMESQEVNFEIFDLSGRKLYNSNYSNLASGVRCLEIPAEINKNPGIYLAKVATSSDQLVQKFIVQ